MNQTPQQMRDAALVTATGAGCITGLIVGAVAFFIFAAIPPTRPVAGLFAAGAFLVAGFRIFGVILNGRTAGIAGASDSIDQQNAALQAKAADLERKIAEEKRRRGIK